MDGQVLTGGRGHCAKVAANRRCAPFPFHCITRQSRMRRNQQYQGWGHNTEVHTQSVRRAGWGRPRFVRHTIQASIRSSVHKSSVRGSVRRWHRRYGVCVVSVFRKYGAPSGHLMYYGLRPLCSICPGYGPKIRKKQMDVFLSFCSFPLLFVCTLCMTVSTGFCVFLYIDLWQRKGRI